VPIPSADALVSLLTVYESAQPLSCLDSSVPALPGAFLQWLLVEFLGESAAVWSAT